MNRVNYICREIGELYQQKLKSTSQGRASKTAYDSRRGGQGDGGMPNNGSLTGSIDGLTTTSLALPAGYTTGGTISLLRWNRTSPKRE